MRQRPLEARIAWTDVEHLKEVHTFPAPPIFCTLTHINHWLLTNCFICLISLWIPQRKKPRLCLHSTRLGVPLVGPSNLIPQYCFSFYHLDSLKHRPKITIAQCAVLWKTDFTVWGFFPLAPKRVKVSFDSLEPWQGCTVRDAEAALGHPSNHTASLPWRISLVDTNESLMFSVWCCPSPGHWLAGLQWLQPPNLSLLALYLYGIKKNPRT